MPITRVEVDEYECALCGHKWISRINGKDGPIPKRCASCKRQYWNKGEITEHEKSYRDTLRQKFGYWYIGGLNRGGWRIEKNILQYLECRPSINEMMILLHPICYLHHYRPSKRKPKVGCVPSADKKHVDMKATKQAHQYERELSSQLLKELMNKRGIPYDEMEARRTILYSRHGTYAVSTHHQIRQLCDALKQDQPELSNEDIKARVMEDYYERLKYMVKSPEDLINSCWPEWINEKEAAPTTEPLIK